MSLKRALLILVVTVLVAAVFPAGIVLERRLGRALVERAREDLARAHMVLEDRWAATRDVRMMHARDLAHAPGLGEALAEGEEARALAILSEAARGVPEEPVLVLADGRALAGPDDPPEDLVDATRRGEMPVSVVPAGPALHLMALAPVETEGGWIGAAGGFTRVDESEAGTLAGLTRSDVFIYRSDGRLVSASSDTADARVLARTLASEPPGDHVTRITVGERSYLVATAPWDASAMVAFARDVDGELDVLPDLRRTAAWSTGLALLLALAVGALFAGVVARPVGALADAADRFAAGDTDAPLPRTSVTEVRRVADAFDTMRETLAGRLRDLERANQELEKRQKRLSLLQAELVQRERLAATGLLLAQLAHEIRNPIASVRNCLEVVKRKGALEGEAREFADMAVDELLRMHELAERMLDQHRPRDGKEPSCEVVPLARDVARLVRAGSEPPGGSVSVVGEEGVRVAVPPDTLKQILLNLVLNAREVTDGEGPVEIVVTPAEDDVRVEILDRGPGIPEGALDRVFDPFFTTKDSVQGVGLGLYTAEGLVRSRGGRIEATNRTDGPGARFVIELPLAPCPAESSS